eukprot:4098788-Amphidinium_carterae.1
MLAFNHIFSGIVLRGASAHSYSTDPCYSGSEGVEGIPPVQVAALATSASTTPPSPMHLKDGVISRVFDRTCPESTTHAFPLTCCDTTVTVLWALSKGLGTLRCVCPIGLNHCGPYVASLSKF